MCNISLQLTSNTSNYAILIFFWPCWMRGSTSNYTFKGHFSLSINIVYDLLTVEHIYELYSVSEFVILYSMCSFSCKKHQYKGDHPPHPHQEAPRRSRAAQSQTWGSRSPSPSLSDPGVGRAVT